jgi:multimeric flavodoxin WrbA
MIGAITGDIVGSIYEHHNIKTKEFADIPIATIDELPEYDGYAFGTPTRFGNMSSTKSDRTWYPRGA